jgi:carbonic anhydrase
VRHFSPKLNRALFLAGSAGYAFSATVAARGAAPAGPGVLPDAALARLLAGNARFVTGELRNPSNLVERRTALAGGQSPYATVLTCSDSRTPPELLFDENVGDLFVVRIAGNYVTNDGLGTIEYGFSSLGSNLLLVLGHSNCGAVKATYESLKSGKPLPPHLDALSRAIGPAIEETVRDHGSLDEAIAANVRVQASAARARSTVLAGGVKAHKLRIVGGTYALESGKVTLL